MNDLYISQAELDGLPPELLKELRVAKPKPQIEEAIVAIVRSKPLRRASIDQILIELFKTTGKVHRRLSINNRLYKMTLADPTKRVIWEDGRGIYTTDAPSGPVTNTPTDAMFLQGIADDQEGVK